MDNKNPKAKQLDYTKIVVETAEKNPVTIATIDADNIEVSEGYRVRLTPIYD